MLPCQTTNCVCRVWEDRKIERTLSLSTFTKPNVKAMGIFQDFLTLNLSKWIFGLVMSFFAFNFLWFDRFILFPKLVLYFACYTTRLRLRVFTRILLNRIYLKIYFLIKVGANRIVVYYELQSAISDRTNLHYRNTMSNSKLGIFDHSRWDW